MVLRLFPAQTSSNSSKPFQQECCLHSVHGKTLPCPFNILILWLMRANFAFDAMPCLSVTLGQ